MNMKSKLKSGFKCLMVLVLCMILCLNNCITVLAASGSGTEKKPYSLERGSSYYSKKYSAKTWYKIVERGKINITFDTNNKSTVTIYKKKTIGKTKVTSFSVNGNKKYSYAANNNTNLLISVEPSKKTTVKVKYDLNVDSKSSSKGGYWKPKSNSPVVTNNDVCVAKYYIPAKYVPATYYALSDNKRLQYLDKGIAMSRNAAVLFLTSKIKLPEKALKVVTAAEVFGMMWDIADPVPSFSFKEWYLSDLKKYSGLNTSNYSATKGVCLTVHLVNGFEMYTIKSWDGKTMKGEKGYTGTFKEFK